MEQTIPIKPYHLSSAPDSIYRDLYLFTFRGNVNYCILVPAKEYQRDTSLDRYMKERSGISFNFKSTVDQNAFFTLNGNLLSDAATLEERYQSELDAFMDEGVEVLHHASDIERSYYEITGLSTMNHAYLFKSICWLGDGYCRLDAIYPQKDSTKWNVWIQEIKDRGVFCY
ncbi:MAG: hypothetical protein K1X55_15060 [Chitinophagales bacterium]|nr:hypothetical protein [Chitinophagales bacterium]